MPAPPDSNGVVLPPSEPTSEHVFIPPSEDAWRNSRDSRKGGASLARYVVSGTAAFGAAMVVVALAASASSGPFDMGAVDRAAPATPKLAASHGKISQQIAIKTAAALKSAARSARHSPTATSTLAELHGGKPEKSSLFQESKDKIQVRLYMESQCPMCKKFSTTYIKQMLATKEMRDIVDFRFVPWGNGAIMDGRTKAVLNTSALLKPVLEQFTTLEQATQGGNGMSNMLSNLEHGIASAWGSLEKEFSALKQMDSINPKYLAHGKAELAAKRKVKQAAQDRVAKSSKAASKAAKPAQSPLEKLKAHKEGKETEPEAATAAHRSNAKLASWLAQHSKTDDAAAARIAKLSGLRKEVAEIDLEAQELKQLPHLQTLQSGNSTNGSAAASQVDSFESWWSAQPKFDMEAWLASKSTKNASDPRSEMQIWLDDQPSFDLEAWLDAQPNFDLNAYLNPPPPSSGNSTNTSLAQLSSGEGLSTELRSTRFSSGL